MSHDGEADAYRVHAAQCVLLARKTDDPESKSALLNMAQAWLALVDQNDRNSQSPTLVYETPAPRQHVAQQQQQPQPRSKD
jgi:hypothetical protein